jgi:transposase
MGENELMTMSRRQHSGEFKAKVVLEALRGERTITELAAAYGVHPLQITQWKRLALEELPTRLSRRRGTKPKDEDALKAVLYQQLGQLNVALDGLKKPVGHLRCAAAGAGGSGSSPAEPASAVGGAGVGTGALVRSASRPERRGCRAHARAR